MKVRLIELRIVEMKLKEEFETSFGKTLLRLCIIVRIICDDVEGWAEIPVEYGPWYSYETVKTAWHILEDYIIPWTLGRELESPREFPNIVKSIRGHNMAKAGVEMALWDCYARLQSKPLYEVLGGVRDRIVSGVSIGIKRTVDELIKVIQRRLDEGYPRIKIKIKPGWDVEVVERIRKEYPDIMLQVDANAAYTLNDLETLRKLDDYNLLMIEQPLDYNDLIDHSYLQKLIKTDICLDESIKCLEDAVRAYRIGSCRVINIKPARVGGHATSIEIQKFWMQHGLGVWIGGMLETGIGRAHNVALASLPGVIYPSDISASNRYWKKDIVEPEFTLNNDGTIDVPKKPGIGVEVLEKELEKHTRRIKIYRR